MNPPVSPPTPHRRRWLFRLAAILLGSGGLLGVLELSLRLLGIGWPTHFFLPARIANREVLIENPRFTWRFLSPALARPPQPLVVPVVRDTNTVRVVVLGESAAMGDPEPAIGYPRVLQALLEARLPGRKVEVINTAITAINSHVIREIAHDCAPLGAEVWVVYVGNNEVMGPFGPGTVFGQPTPSPTLRRAGLWLKTTRTGQALDLLAARLGVNRGTPTQWTGLEMFLDRQVAADDPRLPALYQDFAANLRDIIDTGRRAGARVVVSTVAVNLRDSAPFASRHRPGLTGNRLNEWNHLTTTARDLAATNRLPEAIQAWAKASQIDDAHAETTFRIGRTLLDAGNTNSAIDLLHQARDLDTLRFRADSRLNAVIRQVASNRIPEGVWLVDSERTFAVNSRRGVPGDELFWEHVHFRLPGSYLLALATGTAVLDALPESVRAGARPEWLSLNELAQRLVVTRWGDARIVEGMRSRLRRPPFNTQATAPERDARLLREQASLAGALGPTAFNSQADGFRRALQLNPDDWVLHDQFGRLHESFGDTEGALKEWQRVIELVPHHAAVRLQIGRMLATQDATASQALPYLQEFLRLRPHTAEAHASLGQAFARLKQFPAAYAEFERATQLRPDLLEAQVQWGIALAADRQTDAARARLQQALTVSTNSALAHLHLARLGLQTGNTNAARAEYLEVLRLAPNYREALEFFAPGSSTNAPSDLYTPAP